MDEPVNETHGEDLLQAKIALLHKDVIRCNRLVADIEESTKAATSSTMIRDLILFCDTITNRKKDSESLELTAALDALEEEALCILERADVYRITFTDNKYHPRQQRAISTVPCTSKDQQKNIVETARYGYQDSSGRLIRPADVVVSLYKEEVA